MAKKTATKKGTSAKSVKKNTAKKVKASSKKSAATTKTSTKRKVQRAKKSVSLVRKKLATKKTKGKHPAARRTAKPAERPKKIQAKKSRQPKQTALKERENYAIRIGDELYAAGFENEVFLPRKASKKMNIHRGTDDHPTSIVNDNYGGGLPEEDYYENRDKELYKDKKD